MTDGRGAWTCGDCGTQGDHPFHWRGVRFCSRLCATNYIQDEYPDVQLATVRVAQDSGIRPLSVAGEVNDNGRTTP
jgi:hypothetical protein